MVGTDVGAYASSDLSGRRWAILGGATLPNTPVLHLALKPGDPSTLVTATYGRGVYTYQFNNAPRSPARHRAKHRHHRRRHRHHRGRHHRQPRFTG